MQNILRTHHIQRVIPVPVEALPELEHIESTDGQNQNPGPQIRTDLRRIPHRPSRAIGWQWQSLLSCAAARIASRARCARARPGADRAALRIMP